MLSTASTEFLVQKMFCNDILFELVLVHLKDDRGRGEFVTCLLAFVLDDLAQYLSCVLFAT